ncbi:hypothetical protein ISN45_Aa02g021000 [Arabidopsis thaliana x Arabidopsis arenosa]|uniref:Uncharacterized protein n=1 Tax=Arabidopsis thaliana x Arabidopsis arenosa TaxID=1240361 RepID=A0A8T2BMT3_9BRAS|nr:hypothetical protein ISN45_Aa02g021000 [Arabidopsis thaliana x Arabidopsis arenosa]
MDYDVLLLNFGGLQVIAPPIASFVGFHAIEIDVQTLQLFLQIDVDPTTAGYFVALMVSVAESLVQSDTPHILSEASLENELWSVCKLLVVLVGACVMLLLRDVFQFQFNLVILLVVDSTNTTLSLPRNDMTMCSKTGGADSDHWLFKRHLALLLHLSFAQVYEVFYFFLRGRRQACCSHVSWEI